VQVTARVAFKDITKNVSGGEGQLRKTTEVHVIFTHAHTHTHTHTQTHTLTHTHTLSLTLTHSHSHTLTRTHTHTYTLSLSHTRTLFLSLFHSLSHTHSHTHTHTHTDTITHTWFESLFQVGHQVVLLEDQRPVQVGDGQIGQRAQTLDHKLLRLLLLTDLGCQVTDVFLHADRQTEISESF